jgi:D-sedoheptulose 7-phosphate isomerase
MHASPESIMPDAITALMQRRPDLSHLAEPLRRASALIVASHRTGGALLACGNGGSCADADHLVGELAKGFLLGRALPDAERAALTALGGPWPHLADKLQQGLRAINLGAQAALATAIANDLGGDLVFAQQVLALGRNGDVLVCFSTSGMSANVVRAAELARIRGLRVIAFTGRAPSALSAIADVLIAVPAQGTAPVQELHLPCYHALCEDIEQMLYG